MDAPVADCFVCRKHLGLESVPGGAIFENALVYVSHAQLWRQETDHYLGHLFVEPIRHVSQLAQLSEAEAREVGFLVTLAARALQEVLRSEHVYSFVLGDHVPHVHVHVIGRYPGAPSEFWGTKVDEWPEAPRGSHEAIATLAARLREQLLSYDR